MMKLSTIKIIILKSKLTLNKIRTHNDESENGDVIRSLLMEVKNNRTMLTED